MKNLILLLSAVLLANVASAVSFSFMVTPYQLLDEYTMTLWKPLINLVLISWSKTIICDRFGSLITDALSMSNSMSASE